MRFHEEQRFRQPWLWAILGVVFAATLVAAWSARSEAALLAPAIALLVGALVLFATLVTEVTDDALIIRFRGLWPTQRVRLADIVRHEVVSYRGLVTGYGIRFSITFGTVYNVSGDRGVRIELAKGKGGKLMVGSQRAEELDAAIGAARRARGLET